jgi:MFS family permease
VTATTLSPSDRVRSLVAVIASASVAGMSFGMVMPLLNLILDAQGVSAGLIGLNAATPSLAVLLTALLMPRIVARVGPLVALYAAAAITVSVLLLLPVFPNVWAWFPLRFLYGIGGAIQWIASETWINAVATNRNRGRVVGFYAAIFAAGFAGGPLLVAFLGIAGWPPFLAAAGMTALATIPLLAAHGVAPRIPSRSAIGLVAAVRRAPVILAATLACGFLMVATISFLPIYGLRMGSDRDEAVLLLAVFLLGNMALQMPLGWLADRWSRNGVLLLAGVVCILGPVLLSFVIGNGYLLWPLLAIWGGAATGIYAVGLTILGDRFGPGELAAASAVFAIVFELGSITGPVASGKAMDLWGPPGFIAVLVIVATAFVIHAVFQMRRGEHAGGGA